MLRPLAPQVLPVSFRETSERRFSGDESRGAGGLEGGRIEAQAPTLFRFLCRRAFSEP
jgi:hypothetical protein